MKQQNKAYLFFKRNAAYIVLALCVLAIGLTLALVTVSRNETLKAEERNHQAHTEEPATDTPDPAEPENPSGDTPAVTLISFIVPVEKSTAVEDYSETLVYNSTLKRYEAHKAMDFFAEEGTPVFAVYDGVIADVSTTLLTGTTVTVDHGNGLFSVYNSLSDGDKVFVGQTVKQGVQIGEVSSSNRTEAAEGAHLHFYVLEDGAVINPAKYLASAEK